MDFTFTPEQDEAAALAAKILGDRATPERMRAVEGPKISSVATRMSRSTLP